MSNKHEWDPKKCSKQAAAEKKYTYAHATEKKYVHERVNIKGKYVQLKETLWRKGLLVFSTVTTIMGNSACHAPCCIGIGAHLFFRTLSGLFCSSVYN